MRDVFLSSEDRERLTSKELTDHDKLEKQALKRIVVNFLTLGFSLYYYVSDEVFNVVEGELFSYVLLLCISLTTVRNMIGWVLYIQSTKALKTKAKERSGG